VHYDQPSSANDGKLQCPIAGKKKEIKLTYQQIFGTEKKDYSEA